MAELIRVVAEWVLTNGKLPGFDTRLQHTFPMWSVVGQEGKIVYRAQGGTVTPQVAALPASLLQMGIRPVFATSKTPDAIVRYAGTECCMFEIMLQPGTRYIDVNEVLLSSGGEIEPTLLKDIRSECPETGAFPTTRTPIPVMRDVIMSRCIGRTKYKGTPREEVIPPEQEIMVDGVHGNVSVPSPIEPILGKQAFRVVYTPQVGRGRTFRRKAKRMNKNGHRPTRKSKRWRYVQPRNC
jgi:hypothetical protein